MDFLFLFFFFKLERLQNNIYIIDFMIMEFYIYIQGKKNSISELKIN